MKCFLWIYSLAHTCNRRRVWWSLVTQTSLTISPQLTSTLGSSSRVSDSTVPTFISASLIRSWTSVETCVHFSNKTDFISPLSLVLGIFFFCSYTAQWILEENGSSSTNTSRRTDSTGESSCFTSLPPPSPLSYSYSCFVWGFFSSPILFCKDLFTQECRKCWLCSVRLSRWYWWLRTMCLTDCWKSCTFLPPDAIRQRLISSCRIQRLRGTLRILYTNYYSDIKGEGGGVP